MNIVEFIGWSGVITATVRDLDGNIVAIDTWENLITNAGKNLLVEALRNSALDAEIKYLAVGTSNTAPAVGNTTLGTEAFRKQVTSQVAGTTGQTKTVTYLAPQDANVLIEELGWFAGSAATASANTGVLVARTLYTRAKTDLESIQVDRTDTLS